MAAIRPRSSVGPRGTAETWFVGPADDPLFAALVPRLDRRGRRLRQIDDVSLFGCRFSLEVDNAGTRFEVLIGRERVSSERIAGAVVRPSRVWAPRDLAEEDAAFVHHETWAAWIAALACLPGAVVNRYPVDWWVDEVTYLDRESARVADATRMPHTPGAATIGSVYVVDGVDVTGQLPPSPALHRWAFESGLRLARVDLSDAGVVGVDPMPSFAGEAAGLVDLVTDAVAQAVA